MPHQKIDPMAVARIKYDARCPDCTSTVHFDKRTRRLSVEHDNTCPTLAAVTRRGGSMLAFVRADGESPDEFEAFVAGVAAQLGGTVKTNPYQGLRL